MRDRSHLHNLQQSIAFDIIQMALCGEATREHLLERPECPVTLEGKPPYYVWTNDDERTLEWLEFAV